MNFTFYLILASKRNAQGNNQSYQFDFYMICKFYFLRMFKMLKIKKKLRTNQNE